MQRINQNMTGYRMPAYVEEILTENYCKNFVRMSIIRDNGNYSFSYKPAGLSRLDPAAMNLYDKLLLIALACVDSNNIVARLYAYE